MKVRSFDPDRDYKDACHWWEARKWAPVPIDHLPASGFVIEEGETKFAAAWLYLTSCPSFAWLEFMVANPKAPLKRKKESLEKLVEFILTVAGECGVKSVFTSLSNENLMALYERKGFQVADRGVTNLVARVG